MKEEIAKIVEQTILDLSEFNISNIENIKFDVQVPKKKEFGDFSTNAALIISNKLDLNSREVAKKIVEQINKHEYPIIDKLDIAGPGFINFYIKETSIVTKLIDIFTKNEKYGSSNIGQSQKVIVEFVSANPTGLLHFGHARNAVVGDSICRILNFSGYKVTREFYINDAGRQMEMLAESVYARYMQIWGFEYEIPEDGYHGDYIVDIANEIKKQSGDKLTKEDKNKALEISKEIAYKILLGEIKKDLKELRVEFDNWYSERSELHDGIENRKLNTIKEKLGKANALEIKDGALWFKATEFGDSQDWVLIKSDDAPTYFIADIAYHDDKYERGYTKLINVWGADHHSHFTRLKAAMKALGHNEELLDVLLIQFVRLIKEGKEVSMSKRAGTFITLRDVLKEVGCDVTRFFLLMRSSDSHLDFDLDLAAKQSNDNPVYYVQYAHARISSILRNANDYSLLSSQEYLNELKNEDEKNIVKKLLQFPEVIETSSNSLSPHKIVYYLQELASEFHMYYNKSKIINLDDKNLSSARIYLISCIQIVIRNGLNLLGVNAPDRM
ncbi:MAG: arginine--tRNA ligase [Candidatus Dadabacteria bacterium]|nr:arginine--tRNA ligase [Candidatus Dadabacteria bacterium]NIQ14065.1 arginine--tRNA ligase [Candidatus Dadabacteria bacterium]